MGRAEPPVDMQRVLRMQRGIELRRATFSMMLRALREWRDVEVRGAEVDSADMRQARSLRDDALAIAETMQPERRTPR